MAKDDYFGKHRKIRCNNCNGKGSIIVEGKQVKCGVCLGQGNL